MNNFLGRGRVVPTYSFVAVRDYFGSNSVAEILIHICAADVLRLHPRFRGKSQICAFEPLGGLRRNVGLSAQAMSKGRRRLSIGRN